MSVVDVSRVMMIMGLFHVLPMTAHAESQEPAKLNRLCSEAVGEPTVYDLLEGCACPRGTVFTLAAGKAQCVARQALDSASHCAAAGDSCLIGADRISAGNKAMGATVSLHSNSAMAQKVAQSFAGGAFERWLPAQGYGSETRYQFAVDYPDFFADLKDQTRFKHALGLGETLLSSHQGALGSIAPEPKRYYAHSPEYLSSLVGFSEDFNDQSKGQARSLLKTLSWLRPLYLAYSTFLADRASLQNPAAWKFSAHKGNGCEDACRMMATLEPTDAHRVHYWQEVIRGKIAKRYLVLSSVNSDSQMILFFSPNFVPSMIGELSYSPSDFAPAGSGDFAAFPAQSERLAAHFPEQKFSGQAEQLEKLQLYDLTGQPLAEQSAPVYSHQLRLLFVEHKKAFYPEGGKPIIVCGGGSGADQLDWLDEQLRKGAMLLGPHNSLYGWSPGTYVKAALKGVSRVDFGMLSDTKLSFGPLRAAVEAASSVATEVRAVPIGGVNCPAHIAAWRPDLRATRAEVVLLPEASLLMRGTASCREQQLQPIEAMGDMLFVAAAGNDGRENFAGSSCLSARPKDNILTVAGAINNAGDRWNASNYGPRSADVLAYSGAQHPTEPLYDTRYGAARTAALAATLIADEHLSPSEARLAILLGATYDDKLKSVSRSSAWLDFSWFFAQYSKKEVRP